MELLRRIAGYGLDFLFPKKKSVVELETISTSELTVTLPPAEPAGSDDTIALFDYSHPLVRDMVWELKYNGNKQVVAKLGEMLWDVLTEELAERELFGGGLSRPVLMPIPVSDKRRYERGWNQAELLCEAVLTHDMEKSFKYLPRHLAKLRHTDSQTQTASKKEREENIRGSMRVLHPPAVEGRCVILLDDVLTTGATFAEAKRALRDAGAKKILCVAVAH